MQVLRGAITCSVSGIGWFYGTLNACWQGEAYERSHVGRKCSSHTGTAERTHTEGHQWLLSLLLESTDQIYTPLGCEKSRAVSGREQELFGCLCTNIWIPTGVDNPDPHVPLCPISLMQCDIKDVRWSPQAGYYLFTMCTTAERPMGGWTQTSTAVTSQRTRGNRSYHFFCCLSCRAACPLQMAQRQVLIFKSAFSSPPTHPPPPLTRLYVSSSFSSVHSSTHFSLNNSSYTCTK